MIPNFPVSVPELRADRESRHTVTLTIHCQALQIYASHLLAVTQAQIYASTHSHNTDCVMRLSHRAAVTPTFAQIVARKVH